MVVEIEHGQIYPIIHSINRHHSDTSYEDNTYGWWATTYDYYLVSDIPQADFKTIGLYLQKFRWEFITVIGDINFKINRFIYS